jgi:hypothetical protein
VKPRYLGLDVREITSTGSLTITDDPNSFNTNPGNGTDVVFRTPTGYEDEGDYCIAANGQPGRFVRAPTGGLICQVEGSTMSTEISNLGNLPSKTLSVNTEPSGYEKEGESCTTHDGRRGKLVRAKTGGLICQVEGSDMDKVSEAATTLRFSSASRMQIGKAYMDYAVKMTAVQGTGNLTISRILGTPGAWYFTVSSPTDNQFLDPSKITTYDGVTVTAVAGGVPQAASAPQPKSVKEKVQERVQAILNNA